MLFAYAEATVPKITVICRKDYGGGKQAMCSKPMGTDLVLAWPSAELAVMGAEGAVNVLFRNDIKAAPDPRGRRKELIEEYRLQFSTPYQAAGKGMIDAVIEPRRTRAYLSVALESLRNKRDLRPQKKHGLIPL